MNALRMLAVLAIFIASLIASGVDLVLNMAAEAIAAAAGSI